ncbi:hypothetical protein JCM17846_27640 [Iodidimonas nitroreducens]|uniref:DUF2147 domain-containing protein n=1 Tax=Iodidimonas nitroreducens TaxID=1236968 RepID=A0A5A7NA19_9PROT|nr:DUF2147 domain-containing protein [Iodidimonas nitroreducens]GAK33118.1 hypothetical protein AQ1_01003 [alpha proteobacterium Q-1]GER05082.1 hypothetical protein JCM17846_27640 [Iodidimonas nitroreducens]
MVRSSTKALAFISGVIIALFFAISQGLADPQASSVLGVWKTDGDRSAVVVQPCDDTISDQKICGNIIWTESGKRLGALILSDFLLDDDGLQDGWIHDPRSGKSYRAQLHLKDENSLEVKGCWLVFCQSQVWTRASSLSFDPADMWKKSGG